MKVYRLEHTYYAHGPYNCRISRRFIKEQLYLYGPGRPSPSEDGIDPNFKGSYGFISKEQMCRWFRRRTVVKLIDMGFRIMEYEVNPDFVRVGKHQCLFLKQHAYSKRKIPLK